MFDGFESFEGSFCGLEVVFFEVWLGLFVGFFVLIELEDEVDIGDEVEFGLGLYVF